MTSYFWRNMSVGATEIGNEIELQDYYFQYCEFGLTPSFRGGGVGRRHVTHVKKYKLFSSEMHKLCIERGPLTLKK